MCMAPSAITTITVLEVRPHARVPLLLLTRLLAAVSACACAAGLATCMDTLGEGRQRPVQKAKMEIWLKKSADFDSIMAAERENGGRGAGGHEEEHEEDDAAHEEDS